jgi:hypothetical protein
MPTYGKETFKESNVNYLNKDFQSLKTSLMNYAKSYFPNSYRDFNEASPGMMLLEMNAYVGDVLNFYIDQQYRELLLPLAEERRNVITLAKMFGYKVKPIVPAYVDLTFTSEVNALTSDASKIDYSNAGTFDAGIEITSDSNTEVIFTTLEPIDFQITGSADGDTIGETAGSGLAQTYTLTRNVKAVSAKQKTISFQVGVPEKFKTLTIPDTNVVDIISCIDSNGNNWYEVDFLAQDKVPISTHYTTDINRDSAYSNETGGLSSTTAVPFSLSYIATTKRFTRETNQDNTTSLVFGNGVLKNGQIVDEGYIDLEQIGITIPGQSNDLNDSIDPLLGDEYSTLGEAPNQVTLTITYRVGGGVSSNVPSGDITTTPETTAQNGNTSATLTSVINNAPARGGKDEESVTEIKEKAKAFFSTQNRAVTKEDYEARLLNMPSKYGNIAKVYVTRNFDNRVNDELNNQIGEIAINNNNIFSDLDLIKNVIDLPELTAQEKLVTIQGVISPLIDYSTRVQDLTADLTTYATTTNFSQSPINIYVLGYNNRNQFIGNPHANSLNKNDDLPVTLITNIKKYLENFNLLTDVVTITDGYIVNFGVIFDVIAEKYADKQQVKLNCIQRIKDYFANQKMQFNQPIYKSQLEFEIMGVEGVRSIGHVILTQHNDYITNETSLTAPTYTYSYSTSGNGVDIDGDGVIDGGFVDQSTAEGTSGYGYKYNFENALSDDGTIILPPNIATPTVFELKNPNQNIQGRVR